MYVIQIPEMEFLGEKITCICKLTDAVKLPFVEVVWMQVLCCRVSKSPDFSQVHKEPFPGSITSWAINIAFSSVQFSSVAQSGPTLCNSMNSSTPGLPIYDQLPEFTQSHVHRVSDAIQLSHPLSSPSPPAPNPSQHQRLFQ